jgi:predicted neuraminidase
MKKLIITALFILIAIRVAASDPFKGEKCIIKTEFIWQPGDVTYPSCHASTIVQTSDGLLAAWFGGTAEKNPDVGISISHNVNGKWTKPVEVVNGIQHKSKRYPCWNPVLYNTGREIILFYKVGPSPSAWWGEMMTSPDNGYKWSVQHRLPEDIYGPVKNKPVLLQNGDLLCPSSTEYDGWRVHMEITPDNGLTWERTPFLNPKEIRAIQPTILLHKGGIIQMLCRGTGNWILSSWSKDNGRTWDELLPTTLPNPNSGIDGVTLKDGRHLLVYNHLIKGRNVLNVAVSGDGKAWEAVALLENDLKEKEYSYPAVIQSDDGLVHITYTWNRKLIKHVVLDPSKISSRPFQNGEWPVE